MVGGTSPFGTRKVMPLFMERSILDLPGDLHQWRQRAFLVASIPMTFSGYSANGRHRGNLKSNNKRLARSTNKSGRISV